MGYTRVLPRDLFNEAKLLKCLGRLALLVHDYADWSERVRIEGPDDGDGFSIDQCQANGWLVCENIFVYRLQDGHAIEDLVHLVSPYNSKEPYPLMFLDENDDPTRVFYDDGKPTEEFKRFIFG